MAYSKFKKSAARTIQRRFKKRYVQRKGKVRYGKLARDIVRIKGMLNSETKFCDTNISPQLPTASQPSLLALETPDNQGLQGVNQRVGSKVRFTHISAKLRVGKQDFGFTRSNLSIFVHVLWLKNGNFASDLEANAGSYILNPDQYNNYSPLSYFNQSNYDSWVSIHKISCSMTDLVQPSTTAMGLQTDQGSNNTLTNLGKQPNTQYKYYTLNKKISFHTEWYNVLNTSPGSDTDEISRWKPYIFCTSDVSGATQPTVPNGSSQPSGSNGDRIWLEGTVRLSYKDN